MVLTGGRMDARRVNQAFRPALKKQQEFAGFQPFRDQDEKLWGGKLESNPQYYVLDSIMPLMAYYGCGVGSRVHR
jgi:hypothetical protein